MKKRLMVLIKYFKCLYTIYFYVFGFVLSILKIFIKPDKRLILINSFGGKKYDDSPKVLYEAMIQDERFKEYKIVWAFHEPTLHNIPNSIKADTIKYFITALRASCWISNSAIERGLSFKNKKTFYFNTWHGSPIKKMGEDIEKKNKSFRSKGRNSIDVMVSQSDFEADIFSRAFGIPRKNFLMCGMPRNDILVHYTCEQKKEIKEKLRLPVGKKVILYAPTFREYERDKEQNCVLIPPMNIEKWQNELEDDFCLLFRAHYEVGKVMNVEDNDFVKNMTSYLNLNELMIVADVLISDYSSIFFDFSIMDKILLHFTYDYDKYEEHRGMYFDIREMLSGGDCEEDVIKCIKNMDIAKEKEKTKIFRDKYMNYYGNATKESLDCIIKHIGA